MTTYYYNSSQTLERREGRDYSTTYYKQEEDELARIRKMVFETIKDLGYLDRLGYAQEIDWFFSQVLKKHRKKTTGKGLYTVQNCIEDMVTQLNSKQKNGNPKDLPLSIVNRWNKAFEGCENRTIEMKRGTRPKNTYEGLFSFYDKS